ncbi:hypothetical protein FHW94_002692 [Novosphingobium sp. SG720]|nr:hypothetical protein [Novosphingobium sp. SG720]
MQRPMTPRWAALPLVAPTLVMVLAGCVPSRLPALEATLAAQPSATAALAQWCNTQGLADPATIRAAADRTPRAAPPAVRSALGVAVGEPLGFRHVRLSCGGVVLSDAQNWFVPARLTPAMNDTLAHTDTPFGTVVAPLQFTRQRLAARRGRMAECPAGTVLSHRAVLRRPDGAAISLVVECYTRASVQTPPASPR